MHKINHLIEVETLVLLAQEIDGEDLIDWKELAINKETAYRLVATSVLEMFSEPSNSDQQISMLTTITKLIVENMTLNLKLLKHNE